jgi:ATP-dependent helicase/nuclease subunit B
VSAANHVLCVSPNAEARLGCAQEFLRGLPARGAALLLLPSMAAGTELMARVLTPGEARFGWRKRSLEQLARELALPELARTGRVPLSGLSLEALVARVLHELAGQGALERHAVLLDRPGFARAMSKTLDELRMSCVDAAQLAGSAPELGRVLAAYERALVDLQLADRAHVFAAAARVAGASIPLLALDVPLVHQCEATLALALGAGRAQACATVARGDERSEAHWRSALGAGLAAEGARARVEVRRLVPAGEHDLARLQRGLFSPRAEIMPRAVAEHGGTVAIVSSPGEAREAVEIARGLVEAASEGVPFDRMAVLLRASEGYRAVIEEALGRAEVPAHFADGVRRPLSSGRAFLALLACAREGLSARGFAEYLSLGEYPREDKEIATPRRWERMLVDAAVIGGRERWTRRIGGLVRELREEQALLGPAEARHASIELEVDQLRALLAFAGPLLDQLAALPERAAWGAWLDALRPLASRALRTPDGVLGVLAELAPLAPIGPVSLAEVQRVLAPRLASFVMPSTGLGAGKVFVGTIDDVRGRAFDLVFVPGLAERVFPQRIAEDPLLPDELRRELGAELWLAEERVAGERLLLRIAVGAARQRLVLSFPRFDVAHGRPRVPSFYGLEVLQAIDGSLPAYDELTRRAHPGAAARMGFPAPDNARQAIDDAEYDLSMLARLQRAPLAERTGAARYLLQANPHLARALRFRARRWELAKFSPADGFVATDDAGRALLNVHRLSARSYSASALSQFAACPYRFYLQSIARVAERPEVFAIDELDARQRGVLFHRVQRALLSELAARGMLPLQPAQLAAARELLALIFAQLGEQARDQYAPSIDGVFEAGLRALARDLDEWLARMLEERVFVPRNFELAFGLTPELERDRASRAEPVQLSIGLTLIGAIDLVEQSGEGERAVLRATDFKTSRAPEQAGVVDGGRSLQPLLYALALEQLFPGQRVASGRLYYCTSRGDFSSHEVALDDSARALGKTLVASIDHMLAAGFLPAAPAALAEDRERYECERCAYRAVCGPYESERVYVVKKRDHARLQPLFHLRSLR